MYKLLRRISSSFFPRPDRPWSEDATSTAPQIGRKRRLSTTEPDEPSPLAKKRRDEPGGVSEDEPQRETSPCRPGKETEGVKEVTKGVRDVELEGGKTSDSSAHADAAAIPLPESPILQATQEAKPIEDASQEPNADAAVTEETKEEGEALVVKEPVDATESGMGESQQMDARVNDEDEIPGLTAGAEQAAEMAKTAGDAHDAEKEGPSAVVATKEQSADNP
ncbi:hypothetical protein AcV5_009483 [Taiwanofungus camphoratus]|nr:hypothetical protein AcV5_009483 [Antrodia cinnamomea]KAI0943142.1 hypothetical protein AcV7_002372 [Antrodia cinnamomea]